MEGWFRSRSVTFFFCQSQLFGPGHAKMCLMPYVNNKGADQPAHLCSLISTFVVHCLDSIPEDTFSCDMALF